MSGPSVNLALLRPNGNQGATPIYHITHMADLAEIFEVAHIAAALGHLRELGFMPVQGDWSAQGV